MQPCGCCKERLSSLLLCLTLSWFSAWTDTESQSGSEQIKGSIISVREAENSIDNTEFGGTPEPPTTSDVNSTHETFISESTRNGFSQDGDAESEAMSESQKKSKIKRNTISPVDEEISESGRGTPDSLPPKGMMGCIGWF